MRFTRAILYVKDLQRMAVFYEKILGLKPTEETRMEDWVEFEAGASRFALHAIPPAIADHIQISSPPLPREENPVKLTFEVDDIKSEQQRLNSLGVVLIQRSWGGWDGIDPEGNVFGIYAAPRA